MLLRSSAICLVSVSLALAAAASAQSLEVLPAQGSVFMIAGPGGNTTVQVGHEAVIVVDTQTAEVSDELLTVIETLSSKPIRHIVNTSADAHHTGGNAPLSRAGTYVRLMTTFDPRGLSSDAAIVAHVNVLNRMSTTQPDGTELPAATWPSDTYFTESWEFFANNEAVRLLHVPQAHSDGDTIVFFRRSDVVSTGDIFNTDRYPSFDVESGGVDGIIEGLNMIVDLAIPGENQHGGTMVIPGHGRLSDETEVVNYRDMITIVRDRIQAMIDEGFSLRQVRNARPTFDYDGIYTGAQGGLDAGAVCRGDLSGSKQGASMTSGSFLGRRVSLRVGLRAAVRCFAIIGFSAAVFAQPPSGGPAAGTARERALIDITGQWVSVVTEDWLWRMVTPPAGDTASVPLNPAGREVALAWDRERDAAEDRQCLAFGPPGLIRQPGRIRIRWEDDDTLQLDFDAGSQTRRLQFADAGRPPPPSL